MTASQFSVWTIHKSDLDLSKPDLILDYTKGWYWNCWPEATRANYRRALPVLHGHFGTDQILWCLSDPIGWYRPALDQTIWELDITAPAVLAQMDENKWGNVVCLGTAIDLPRLLFPIEIPPKQKCEVLVRWPLAAGCRIRPLGSIRGNGHAIDARFMAELRGDWGGHRGGRRRSNP